MDNPNLNHLSYQQKYYIVNKEKIKKYQKEYYQNVLFKLQKVWLVMLT